MNRVHRARGTEIIIAKPLEQTESGEYQSKKPKEAEHELKREGLESGLEHKDTVHASVVELRRNVLDHVLQIEIFCGSWRVTLLFQIVWGGAKGDQCMTSRAAPFSQT